MNHLKRKTPVAFLIMIVIILTSCTQKSPTHYFKNASAKFSLKDYKGAITDINQALKLKNDYTEAYYVRAICYGELGNIDKAAADFNKVLSMDPNFQDAYVNRAFYVKEPQKDYEGALADYNKFIEINRAGNNAFAYSNRGFVKYNLGNYSDALDDINASLKIDPENSYAYKNMALIYIAMDSLDVACSNLSKALDLGYTTKFDDTVQRLILEYCEQ